MLQRLSVLILLGMFYSSNLSAQVFFPKENLMTVGVYYYPEHWPSNQWERDIKNIADHGFDFIHMAEFAWAQLEPSEGNYDFNWLDEVIAIAHKNNLKVILGTPTPCPPVWLGIKYPEIYLRDANYQLKEHGTRANLSLSNQYVKQYTQKIVEQLAKHYANNPAIMGWQVDNEPEAKEDYSPSAQHAFKSWLKAKYATIQKLNKAWATAFWSQVYADFNEINIHNATNVGWWGANPIALLDFKRFTSDTQAAFLDFQADELKRHIPTSQFVTTNYVAKGSQADPSRSKKLDFASFTAYPNYGSANLGELGFRLGDYKVLMYANDYYNSANGVTGVMELQPGQVNWANHNSLLQPGTVRMWLWHCFAGGSSFACTYRYRQILAGAEQYHKGIVDTDGLTLSSGGEEYVQFIKEIDLLRKNYTAKDKMPKIMEKKKTAILWAFDNLWNLDRQKQTYQWDTWEHLHRYQSILHSLGVPVSIITENDDFNQYDFIVVPAYEMVDEKLVKKWKAFVQQEGELIVSARTGAKDKNAHLWESNLSGIMNELIGGKIKSFDMLPAGTNGIIQSANKTYTRSTWGDLIVPDDKTEVLATYGDQFYEGTACCLRNEIGKGNVWYIGAVSTDGLLEKDLLCSVYNKKGIKTKKYPEGVFVEYRDGFMVAVNYSSQNFEIDFDGDYLIGDKLLEPADVAVWRYAERNE